MFKRPVQGYVGTSDCRGAGATVGLYHVAVDPHLHFAHGLWVGHGPKGSSNEALNFLGAAGLFAACRLAARPCVGRTRQHAVLRCHPTGA